jgi:cysteinyl-tRNA synthetase
VHGDDVLVVLVRRVRSGLVTKAEIEAALASGTPAEEPLEAPVASEAIVRAIARCQAARKAKDFAGADGIREQLKKAGVLIDDLPAGVRWKYGS